jgi:hypothetical protein
MCSPPFSLRWHDCDERREVKPPPPCGLKRSGDLGRPAAIVRREAACGGSARPTAARAEAGRDGGDCARRAGLPMDAECAEDGRAVLFVSCVAGRATDGGEWEVAIVLLRVHGARQCVKACLCFWESRAWFLRPLDERAKENFLAHFS